uniref:C2H2-type domain-containing protein n=1 Tax=Megaselia scalaris TaxID=36166 RepID=T1H1V7_MEGSC
NTHNKVKFDCDICGESYKTVKGLETHKKNKHTENRRTENKAHINCPICCKVYVNKLALQRHMTAAHKIINKQCDYCTDFVAKSQEEYDFHILKYHSQPQTSKTAINDLIMETVEELDEAIEDDEQ